MLNWNLEVGLSPGQPLNYLYTGGCSQRLSVIFRHFTWAARKVRPRRMISPPWRMLLNHEPQVPGLRHLRWSKNESRGDCGVRMITILPGHGFCPAQSLPFRNYWYTYTTRSVGNNTNTTLSCQQIIKGNLAVYHQLGSWVQWAFLILNSLGSSIKYLHHSQWQVIHHLFFPGHVCLCQAWGHGQQSKSSCLIVFLALCFGQPCHMSELRALSCLCRVLFYTNTRGHKIPSRPYLRTSTHSPVVLLREIYNLEIYMDTPK